MASPSTIQPGGSLVGRSNPLAAVDLPRKALGLLTERFPLAKVKHKPLSILRQEGRRALEQYLEAETPWIPKAERDRVIEDVLGYAPGFGALEELFRDEANREIQVLGFAQIIARKGEAWLPTSIRFRDDAHYRTYLKKLLDVGEAVVPSGGANGAYDVKLSNGFRLIAVCPPDVLDLPPMAVFIRSAGPASGVTPTPAPPISRSGSLANAPRTPSESGGSSVLGMNVPMRNPATPSTIGLSRDVAITPAPIGSFDRRDPLNSIRTRVRERIVRKCAAAGVFDLTVIAKPELQKIIFAHVEELNAAEQLGLNDQTLQILTLEILAALRA